MSCATTNPESSNRSESQHWPEVIGHRGGSLEVPENTMAAFRYSRDLGLKWFELDVRMAVDGVVVCHDASLGRLAERDDVEVWKTTTEDLQEFSVGDPKPSKYALGKLTEFGLEVPKFGDAYPAEPIPTLSQALVLAPEIGIMVEMKKGPYGTLLADKTVEEIRRAGVEAHVIIGSFDPLLLDRAAELAPDIPLIGIAEEAEMISELLKRPVSKLAVSQDLVSLAQSLKPDHVSLWVWTIRDISEAKSMAERGVDGLISDIPKKVRDLFSP